jgi:hypothetical protein
VKLSPLGEHSIGHPGLAPIERRTSIDAPTAAASAQCHH